MKTYSNNSSTNEKKKRRNLLALIIGLALIACAIIVTLCITLGRPSKPTGGNVLPPVNENTEQYVMPIKEYTMGKDFSDKLVYNQTLKQWRTHNGVDFMAEKGAEVMAVLGGTVKSIENTTLEGTVITIEQNDGITAIYKSLAETVNVEEGATVKAGDVIGTVDLTMATEKKDGTHLHLEMKKDGAFVSPLDYLPGGSDK